MMIDSLNEFCDATALNTGAAGRYQVGSSTDLGATPGDIGSGHPLYLVIIATTGITLASGTGQLRLSLASDSTSTFTASGSTLHATCFYTTSTTAIPAGTVMYCAPIPMEGQTYERYLGIVQETVTTAINAGAINAFLTPTPQKWVALPDGIPNPA